MLNVKRTEREQNVSYSPNSIISQTSAVQNRSQPAHCNRRKTTACVSPLTTRMLLLLLVVPVVSSLGFTQSTAVEGILMCEDHPAANVLVKLFDHDTLSPDELMDSAKTDENGHFKLSGSADEISGIDPKINIYHDCDDGIKPCQRKLTIFVPSAYVQKTKQPGKPFNLGVLQLAGKFEGEGRDCIH